MVRYEFRKADAATVGELIKPTKGENEDEQRQ